MEVKKSNNVRYHETVLAFLKGNTTERLSDEEFKFVQESIED